MEDQVPDREGVEAGPFTVTEEGVGEGPTASGYWDLLCKILAGINRIGSYMRAMDQRSEDMVSMGDKLLVSGQALLDAGERMDQNSERIDKAAEKVAEALEKAGGGRPQG
jgi:hypothetical protein